LIGDILWLLVKLFNYLVLIFFVVFNSFYFMTSIFAFVALRKYGRKLKSINIEEFVYSAGLPPLSIIAPAYNEEASCVESTRSLLTLNYPEYEIFVVNDGSDDATLQLLVEAFEFEELPGLQMSHIKTAKIRCVMRSRRHRNLWLIDKENGGKSDAINAAVNYVRHPFFCVLDADSILERNSLMRIVRPFVENDLTISTGGIVRIINGCKVVKGSVTDVRLPKNTLARFQVLEYLRAFLFGRMGWNAINATLIISGAFGIFRRSMVIEAGGFATDTVGEDMELIIRLHSLCTRRKIPYRISYLPDPIAWTECPESLRILGRQRDRWQRGLWDSLNLHRYMLFNPRFGVIGMVAFPYYFFLEMLGPFIEFFGYFSFIFTVAMGQASPAYIIAFLMVAFVLGVSLSVAAVGLDELSFPRYSRFSDLFRLFYLAILENFGYRQYLTFFRFKGIISALRRKKGWGKMVRKGFTSELQATES